MDHLRQRGRQSVEGRGEAVMTDPRLRYFEFFRRNPRRDFDDETRSHIDLRVADYITEPSYMTLVAVFEYSIGNTDWSVWGRHNISVLRGSTEPHTLIGVPYDYDFSGAVGAPYATPPPQLPIHSVHERYYRGYCQPDSVLDRALERFRVAKDSIYGAVRSVPGLEAGDAKSVLNYFDGFFRNLGAVRRDLLQACRHLPQ